MILHSDSFIGVMMPFIVMFGAAIALLTALLLSAYRKFRTAAKTVVVTLAGTVVYVLAVATVSLLTPQTIVNVGDSYCFDICFPLIHDPSVIPFDSILDPGQSIKTTLTFATAPDARQLFLTGDREKGRRFW